MNTKQIELLLIALKSDIGEEYRCSGAEDDDAPGMDVTVATTNGVDWNYQTGDNSFNGGAYGMRFWSVCYLFQDSNCQEMAAEIVEELEGAVEMAKLWDSEEVEA